jgi:hypothetical protein
MHAMASSLSARDRRLVVLALAYHLARPGSELDAATRQPLEHGLRELEPLLRHPEGDAGPTASFELDAWQHERLLSAMKGCITELRVHHLRHGAPSTVPGWTQEAIHLFPELQDPDTALDLAEDMMMLTRRLSRHA